MNESIISRRQFFSCIWLFSVEKTNIYGLGSVAMAVRKLEVLIGS